jgi:hypothetical protein
MFVVPVKSRQVRDVAESTCHTLLSAYVACEWLLIIFGDVNVYSISDRINR